MSKVRGPLSTVAVHHSRKVGVASSILAVALVFPSVVCHYFFVLFPAGASMTFCSSIGRACDCRVRRYHRVAGSIPAGRTCFRLSFVFFGVALRWALCGVSSLAQSAAR